MPTRLFTAGALGLVIVGVSTVLVTGQGSSNEVAPAPVLATRPQASGRYVPPRTSWGDPDLQGNFTNKYEQSTPFERPQEFVGRRVDDVRGAELATILAKRQQQVAARPTGVGPDAFRDALDVVKGSRAWLVVDPPDGRIPPLTPDAQRRIASYELALDLVNARPRSVSSFGDGPFDGPEDLSLFDRCITRGVPGSMLPFLHGNSYQIVQAPGLVAIRYEIMHETRVITLDGRPHVSANLRLDMGDPRGHWEGNSLVVDTTNFSDRSAYRSANAATLRLLERFTRTASDRIEWTVTVDDPRTWTRPWTFSMPLSMDDREAVLEFACHEGNYAVPNILSAARFLDRSAATVAKQP